MAEKDLRKWTVFFHDAGVPRGPATGYATLFCDHRIKDDLLGDLTKEILNDIGITVIGDIMSILKHAKAVYAKLEREKSSNQLVQESEPVVSTNEDLPTPSSTQQIKKKKVAPKLLNKPKPVLQQTQPVTTPKLKKLAVEPKLTVTVNDSPLVHKKRPVKSTMTLSERFASETVTPPKVFRLSMEGSDHGKANANTVKKVQTIQSTERLTSTDKEVSSAPVKRKSAFERLGKGETSSLSKKIEQPSSKVIKLTKSPIKAPASNVTSLTKNETSVFKRLGESDTPHSLASTNRTGALTIRTDRGLGSRIVSDDTPEKLAKTHSVLRPLKPIRAVKPVKPVSPVKERVLADATKESSRKSVFSRLGSSD